MLRLKRKKKRKGKRRFISIDPGLGGTGWSVFDRDVGKVPIEVGIINRRKGHWSHRAFMIAYGIVEICEALEVRDLYCEYPAFWDTVAGTMVAKRGDLLKLTFLVGVICAIPFASVKCLKNFELVPVIKWKGQLKKNVVIARILAKLGKEACKRFRLHIWDAVGIGLYKLGLF